MKCRLLLVAVLALMSAGVASATMILQDFDAAKHDRFYVGEDKAFIGDPCNWSGVGRGDTWATMVSPSYFLSANHYHPAVGTTLYFYYGNDPDGGYETRTVLSGAQIGGSDVWLGQLSAPVSSLVTTYPILVYPQQSSYNNLELYTFGLSDKSPTQQNVRLGRNNIDPDSIQSITANETTGKAFLYDYDAVGGLGADESYLQTHDSGGPSFALIGGAPALVGIHWFIWEDESQTPTAIGSGDTFVPYYAAMINAAMSVEQLTIVIPEPATLVMLAVAGLAWLLWRKGRNGFGSL